ncbi:hypothetical protein Btru_076794 [Bulinus truncatus]|nr:hypothetical protein Btru_076794 [Bulinus truncatus]
MDARIKYSKGKIVPINIKDDKELQSFADEMQSASHNKRTTEPDKNKQIPKDLKLILNVQKDAKVWKSFSTGRRNRYPNVREGEIRENYRQSTSCLGLEERQKSNDYKNGKREVEKLNKELIRYFAKLGQSKDEKDTVDLAYVDILIDSGADINCTDKHGQTILHEVAREWHTDVALYLISKGININQGDNYGRTPLHVAAAVDYAPMVELLLKNKADIEAKTTHELQTPVFYAAKNDATNSLKALVKRNGRFNNIQDYKGRTPIYVAAELDRSETTRLLLELNAPGFLSDNDGSRAINWMISKMPPVAYEAVNQLHSKDRPNRKQYYSLNNLFYEREKNSSGVSQTSLHVVVGLKQYDLIMHPVFKRLLDVMWNQFGRKWAWINLCINIIYILLWTVIGVVVEYDKRYYYNLPDDTWRIILFILAALMTFYQIYEEIMEFKRSQNFHNKWEEKRNKDIDRDLKFCHPRWPEEKKYLENEKEELEKARPKYFSDAWNIFDWLCYIALLICMATHVADILDHSEVLARVHIRLLAVTIILLWLQLMKQARAFELLGPFIVMLGHMLKDCVRFLFLYMEFYIPYLTAFWMIFGGTKMAAQNSTEEVTVSGFTYPGELFFSTFRLTLVDDYDYENMQKIDSIMADLLLGTWFMLSAILCLNLFIALLSDTFQRVYDNAHANAVMQRAIFLINIWEGLKTARKKQFLDYIAECCNPLQDEYDDDMTQVGEDDIKKITVQIKDDDNTFQEQNRPLYKTNLQVDEIKESINSLKNEQRNLSSKIQKDLSSVKNMLKHIIKKGDPDSQDVSKLSDSQDAFGNQNDEKLGKKVRRKKHKHSKTISLEINADQDNTSLEETSNVTEQTPSFFPNFTTMQEQPDTVRNSYV